MTSEPMFSWTEQGIAKQLYHYTHIVEQLIEDGATGPAATDDQKWQVGDTINQISAFAGSALGRARRGPAVGVSIPPEYPAKFQQLRERLVTGQAAPRSTLVDYARVAAVIPLTDPLRTFGLTFHFARALSVIDDPAQRLQWAEQAVAKKYSVARLREALNASRGTADLSNASLSNASLSNASLSNASLSNASLSNASLSNASLSKSDPSKPNPSELSLSAKEADVEETQTGHRRGVYVCAQTGKAIVNIAAMVEVHLDRGHPAAPTSLPGRNHHAVLRFVNLSALVAWAVAAQSAEDISQAEDIKKI